MPTNTDTAIEDLEAGFRDLVDGLRAIVRDQREELALLRGLLEEYRRLHGVVEQPQPARIVMVPAPAPEPVAPPAPPLQIVPPAALKRAPRRTKQVMKPCARCKVEQLLTVTRMYCDPCFRAQARERLAADRLARVTAEVDARLALQQQG